MSERPRIACLCGSSRFKDEFEQAAEAETLAGRIVLSLARAHGKPVRWLVVPPDGPAS